MSDIVEIIHKLTFDLNDDGINKAIQKLKEQSAGIDELKKKEQELTATMRKGNALSVNEMQRLSNERIKVRKLIEQETQALRQNFTENTKLQSAIKGEIGLIEQLETRIKTLTQQRRSLTNPGDIALYTNSIKKARTELASLTGTDSKTGALGGIMGSSLVNNLGQGLLYGLGIGGGFGIVTRLTSEMVNFATASAQAYREIEGVRVAFERMGNAEQRLQQLRDATRGTVSDLQLMQFAVQSRNYEVPLNKIAGLFEFARNRARETGLSVDYLVNSIVVGIGRESPKILDNLGINVRTVREEFNRTGDYATAVFNVIADQGAGAASTMTTLADEADRLNAELENMQARIGEDFAKLGTRAKALGMDLFTFFKALIDPMGEEARLVNRELLGIEGTSQLAKTNAAIEATEQAREQERKINEQADMLYKSQFEQFAKEIESADWEHKQRLIGQQEELYKQLLNVSKSGALSLLSLQRANASFVEETGQKKDVNIALGTSKQMPIWALSTLSGEDLQEAQKDVTKFRQSQTAFDRANLDLADKYQGEITRLLELMGLKKEKSNKKNINLERQLWQQLNQLAREGSLLYLRDVSESDTSILEQRINIQRQAALEAINIQENAAREQGALNERTEALFGEIRRKINENFDLQITKDKEKWYRDRLDQENAFYSRMLQMDVQQLQARLKLMSEEGEDTLKHRQAIADADLQLKLQQNSEAYDSAIENARKLGKDTTDIDKQYADEEILIRENAKREKLRIEEEYYQERMKLADVANKLLLQEIQDEAQIEINSELDKFENKEQGLNKYNRNKARAQQRAHRANLRELKRIADEEVALAEQNLNRLLNNPGASGIDIAVARTRLGAARVRQGQAAENAVMLARPRTGFGRFIHGQEDPEQTIQERRIENLNNWVSAWQTASQSIIGALNNIYQAQIASLDAEIAIRSKRVDEAIRLAELGNTEVLRIERDRMDAAIRERERVARRQIAINSALQVSESLVAIASAAGQSGAGAIVIVPAVIAAIAAGFAAVSALANNSPAFRDGVVDFQGKGTGTSDSNTVRISKGESVITADATKKNRDILEAMNKGQVFSIPRITPAEKNTGATRLELKGVENKLDRMIEAYEQTGVNVDARLDEQGFRMRTERNASKNKSRYRR